MLLRHIHPTNPGGQLGQCAAEGLSVQMAQATRNTGRHPRELSFKHTVQLWTAWTAQTRAAPQPAHRSELFRLIAQLHVGHRPGRIEPPRGRVSIRLSPSPSP